MKICVAIIDDQILVRKGLLHSFGGIEVTIDTDIGQVFMEKLSGKSLVPEICILSFQAIMLNNNQLLKDIKAKYKSMKVLIIATYNEEFLLRKMVHDGANEYIAKLCNANELKKAVFTLHKKKYYFDLIPEKVLELLRTDSKSVSIPEKYQHFISSNLAGLTVTEIAAERGLSKRTVKG